MSRVVLCILFAAAAGAVPPAEAAPILDVHEGVLQGAAGVDVAGTLYDVAFKDGTCVAHFNECDGAIDFEFPTATGALAASQALIDQVLTGGFDTLVGRTAGCLGDAYCDVLTPYDLVGDLVAIGVAHNLAGSGADTTSLSYIMRLESTGALANLTFAVWSPAALRIADATATDIAAVPEPASLLLLGTGLAAAASAARRRNRRTAALS